MHNLLKKTFLISMVVVTAVGVLGLGLGVSANTAVAGDLIKTASSSAVYYLDGANVRHPFSHAREFATWYSNFSGVKTVSTDEMVGYTLGSTVVVRPGSRLVQFIETLGDGTWSTTNTPAVYAVGANGTLNKINTAADAVAMYGSAWQNMIVAVPNYLASNYPIGTALGTTYPTGTLVKTAAASQVYYIDGTTKRPVTDAGFTANRFNNSYVLTVSSVASYSDGTSVTALETAIANPVAGSAVVTPAGSGLTVSAGPDLGAQLIPMGATGASVLKFNLTAASNGPTTVNSVTVKRSSLGTVTDWTNVYLYDGNTRLTSGKTLNSTTQTVQFVNLGLVIPAGTTKTLTVKVDCAAYPTAVSGNYHYFSLEAGSVTTAAGTVNGSFPIMSNTVSIASVSSGTVTIAHSGSNPLTSPKAGETAAKVAEFSITMGTEDGTFNGVTLYQVGNIGSDKLSNFVLKQAGDTLATASSMVNSNVVFTLATPMALAKGTVKIYEVYADLSATARSTDTVQFYVDNDADVVAMGKTYGFGLAVTRTAYDNVTADGTDASFSTVEAGQITISQKGPATTDYATQQQDVELLRFDMASQINAEVRSAKVTLTAGGTFADEDITDTGGLVNSDGTAATTVNYTDVKLVDVATGSILAGPQDLTLLTAAADATQQLTFTDTWNLTAGQVRTVKVTADIANFTPHATETIKAQLDAFTATSIKNTDTNLFVATTAIVPSGAIIGSTHNVDTGTLTATLASTPALQTYINGSSDVNMVGLNLAAGTGKSVKVTSIKITVTGLNSCVTEANCVSSAMLYDGTTLLSTKNISGTTITFSGLNVAVAKGTTKALTVKTNLIKLSSVAGSTSLSFAVADNTTDISAQDVEGNTITPAVGSITGPVNPIVSAGTVNVTLAGDDSDTESQIAVAGSTVVLAKYRFTATNEDLKLTKLRVSTANGTAEEVSSMALYDGTTKLTEYVPVTNGDTEYADFNTFLTDFVIPKDSTKTLIVKAVLGSTSNGATSGTVIAASVVAATNFEVRGVNANSNTVATSFTANADVTGRDMYFRKANLVFEEMPLSSTAISNGSENEVYKFKVTPSGNDASLKQLVFNVTQTDNTTDQTLEASAWKIFKGNTDITNLVNIHLATGVDLESTGVVAEVASTKVIVTWLSEDLLTAGTPVSYTLRATLGGYTVSTEDDSIRVILNNDSAVQTSGYNYLVDLDTTTTSAGGDQKTAGLGSGSTDANTSDGTAGATATIGANIIWSDLSVVAHDATLVDTTGGANDDKVVAPTGSADWINGFLLRYLPFSGKTITN